MSDSPLQFTGSVVTGAGQGSSFTRIDWVRSSFVGAVGIEPHPGTLNLRLDDTEAAARWHAYRRQHGTLIEAQDSTSCNARLFPVTLDEQWYAAAVYPEVDAYPTEQIELISAVCLRELLETKDGDNVTVRFHGKLSCDAVMFDVDGTLLNSLDGYLVAVQRAIDSHGYEVTAKQIRQSLNSTREFWHLVLPEHEHDNDELIRGLRESTMRHWPAARDEHVDVLPGVSALLRDLSRSPARLGICTGSYGESFPPLERAGLLELFDVIVTGEHVEQRKPHPEGIVRCLAELGVRPNRAVYIGDSVVDIRAARAAGVAGIGVLTGAGDPATLTASGADRIIADVRGISDLVNF